MMAGQWSEKVSRAPGAGRVGSDDADAGVAQ
jgi:hypothetical protein